MMRTLSRFRDDERGNFALMFAVSTTALIGVVGASIDIGSASSAEARSQQIADTVALSAAIYVRNHSGEPGEKEDGGIPAGVHSAASLGFEYGGLVSGGAEGVTVTVDYDDENNQSIVTVKGKTDTTMTRVLGKQHIDFESQAVVSYEDVQVKDAASIILVLDNSGSMNFDDRPYAVSHHGVETTPTDAVKRITALETSVTNFVDYIEPLVGNQSDDKDKLVRTGLLAYNSNTISARTVDMDWKFPTETEITDMNASGGTNSAPPLDTAREWMLGGNGQTGEDSAHQEMNGKSPLKFVIFMTDGINSGSEEWFDQEGTGEWRQNECRTSNGNITSNCRFWYESAEAQPTSWQGHYSYGGNSYYGYEWIEGDWEVPANHHSLADCTALKAEGVKIFTIGFALQEGLYNYNGWYWNSDDQEYSNKGYQDSEDRSQAYAFLNSCASEGGFKIANDAASLQSAFDSIGQNIVQETIRIKS